MKSRFILPFLLCASLLGACIPQTPIPPATQAPSAAAPTQIALPTQPPAAEGPASGWTEYRDARYGYGLALPCYWTVYPTPSEGMFATLSAHSYSEEFFAAHSERNEWIGGVWPQGAYKIDLTVVEGIDTTLSLEEAIRKLYTTPGFAPEQSLVSLETQTFGSHQGYAVTLQTGLKGGDTIRQVLMPIKADTLAVFNVWPQEAFDQPDIQSILGSFATPDEQVIFPSRAPSGPPDGSPISCG